MDPLPKQHTTDDGYDNFIAFLVLAGALAFILHQSFPATSNLDQSKTNTTAISSDALTPKKGYKPKQAKKEISAYERQQAEREFANNALHKWTEDLETQSVDNTPYRIPKQHTKELAVAATTVPLTTLAKEEKPTEEISLSKKAIVEEVPPGTTVVREDAVFIDTDIKKAAKNSTKEVKKAPDVSLSTAKETVTKTAPKIPSKEQLVDNYEANIPAIAPVTTKKGITATPKKKVKKKTVIAKKKPTEPSCVVMIAALKDKKNIKRLVNALKKEKYKVYNKASGNHRAIGIRTSCDPAVNQPLLRKVKKDFSETAWLLKR